MSKLILAAAALAALTVGAQAADALKIGVEGAYPPYNFVDDNGKVGGYDIEVGNEVCKRAALDCTWVVNEWDTIIPNLIAGNYDAIMSDMSITDERKQTINFSQPYFPPDPSTYISLADKKLDYTALKGLKLGAQVATIQLSYLNANLKANNTILSYDTQDQELADLNAGNIDAVFLDGSVVGETVAGSSGKLKADGPDILIGDGVGVGMRKADAAVTKKIDDALTSMKADGFIDTLIAKDFPDKKGGPFFKK